MPRGQPAPSQPDPAIVSGWHMLRASRSRLAAEIARLSPWVPRETDFDIILESLTDGMARAARDAKADAGRASAIRDAHDRSGSWMERMSADWKDRAASLSIAAEEALQATRVAEGDLASALRSCRPLAQLRVRENREANRQAQEPTRALRERLAAMDVAITAISNGDRHMAACLRRGDIEATVRMADILRSLGTRGRLTEEQAEYYLTAGLPRVATQEDASVAGAGLSPVVDRGVVLEVSISPDGTMSGTLARGFRGVPAGTDLMAMRVLELAELLGNLRMERMSRDADMLQSYMDNVVPGWRDKVEEECQDRSVPSPSPAHDPYDVLGVLRDTPMTEVARIFRELVRSVQDLPNKAPHNRYNEAFKAIRAERKVVDQASTATP